MKCPACSGENRDSCLFCMMCGKRLPVICPKCGGTSEVGHRFCGKCGYPLGEAQAEGRPGTHAPKIMMDSVGRYAAELETLGWHRQTYDDKIRNKLAQPIELTRGEEVVFAKTFGSLSGLRVKHMTPAKKDKKLANALVGTNLRLLMWDLAGRRLHEVWYRDVSRVTEVAKGMMDRNDMVSFSLRGNDQVEEISIEVPPKEKAALLAFLWAVISASTAETQGTMTLAQEGGVDSARMAPPDEVGGRVLDQARPPKAPKESTEPWVALFASIGWGKEVFEKKIRSELRQQIPFSYDEGVVFADNHPSLFLFSTVVSLVSGVVATNRRLIILTTKLLSLKLDVLLEIRYAEVREVADLKQLYFPKTKKTMKLEGGIRISLQGKAEPIDLDVMEAKARTPILEFLQTASRAVMDAPTYHSVAEPCEEEGVAKKSQDIMNRAKAFKSLPAECRERIRLFQAGMNICPACGGTEIERKTGEREKGISGAVMAGAIHTEDALLLPPDAFSSMGTNESGYTCRECTFTWQPLAPKS